MTLNSKSTLVKLAAALACAAVLIMLAAIIVFKVARDRAHAEPLWWQTIIQTQQHTGAADAARSVEAFATTQLSSPREQTQPWTLRLPEAHINAWLGTRFKDWITNERAATWPEGLERFAIRVHDSEITLAALYPIAGKPRVAWWTFAPTISPLDQPLKLTKVGINELEIPISLFRLRAPQALIGSIDTALARPTFEVDSARQVRILKVETQGATLVLTCKTEKKSS